MTHPGNKAQMRSFAILAAMMIAVALAAVGFGARTASAHAQLDHADPPANSVLNVPPTPAGLLHETDVARLKEFALRQNKRLDTDIANRWQRELRVTEPRSSPPTSTLCCLAPPSIARHP